MMFTVGLSKYKYNQGIHLVLMCYPLWSCKKCQEYPFRALSFPQRQCRHARAFPACPCFQLHPLAIADAVLDRRPPVGKTFHTLLHLKFTAFLHRLPHPGVGCEDPSPRLCIPAQGYRCLPQGGKDSCLSCGGQGRELMFPRPIRSQCPSALVLCSLSSLGSCFSTCC